MCSRFQELRQNPLWWMLSQFWLSGAVCQLRRRRDTGWKVDRPYHSPNG
ncbi:MAG: hypothetical protein ABI180_06610 [Microcoleus sp.]